MNRKTKTKIAKDIEKLFLSKVEKITDTRIYFSNKGWNYDSKGNKTIIKNIKATDYISYANNKTVTVSFEGEIYHKIHGNNLIYKNSLYNLLNNKLTTHNYYMEYGDSWNFTIFELY